MKKGDILIGPGASLTVMHIEGKTITVQNNFMHTIYKVPLRAIKHLEIMRIKN